MADQYVLGYGSLLNSESRLRSTEVLSEIIPVKLRGYIRGWFARTGVPGFSTTYVGCIGPENSIVKIDESSFMNGVVYKVNKDHLINLDNRERQYKRVKIDIDRFDYYNKDILPSDAKVWLYTNEFKDLNKFENSKPNLEYPLIQSYIDLCLSGCLEIDDSLKNKELNFTYDFIRSTKFWSKAWVNDRIYPRRPQVHSPYAYQIDEILYSHFDSSILQSIIIE